MIKIENIKIQEIEIPQELKRAMAKQAEAERDKRAKVISADGELQASKKLAEAAEILGSQKDAITLRYLDTMREISSGDGKTTTFFPLPVDFLNMLTKK